MPSKNQARISLRVKMAAADLSVKALAAKVGHPRETVSKAINHGRFPRVRAKIVEVLG